MPLPKPNTYTVEDIYLLPDGQRAELIDGQIYNMAPPSPLHQKLVALFTTALQNYIKSKGGSCEVYPAPFAVFLNQDDRNYVEPDISVICDPSKMNDRGCNGTPDFLLRLYRQAASAWIISQNYLSTGQPVSVNTGLSTQ